MATRQGTGQQPPPARNTGRRRPLMAVSAVAVVASAAMALVTRPAPAAVLACAPTSASIGTGVGQCAPNFTLDDLRGKRVSLAAFHGHPVLLHFWAAGCTTCAAEYPAFSRTVRAYVPKGLVVLAIDAWGEQPALIRRWQDAHHLPANLLVDEPQAVVRQYRVLGTPTTFFIDRTGRITADDPGPLSFGDYQKYLARIVDGARQHQPTPATAPGIPPWHAAAPVAAPCPPPAHAGTRISVACARPGQGYPFSPSVEYIAVSPAAAPAGTSVRVWGSCGCGEGGTSVPGTPVETVRLWLLDTRPLVVTRQKQHRVVNAGHALLGTATLDSHSSWSARVTVPVHIDAGSGPPGRTNTAPGIYAIMVTYPGEDATAHYYLVAPQEGYITRFVITTR